MNFDYVPTIIKLQQLKTEEVMDQTCIVRSL